MNAIARFCTEPKGYKSFKDQHLLNQTKDQKDTKARDSAHASGGKSGSGGSGGSGGKNSGQWCHMKEIYNKVFARAMRSTGAAIYDDRRSELWSHGSTVTDSFINGEEAQKTAVQAGFRTWLSTGMNLKIKYEQKPAKSADIRVYFDTDGESWSYSGTDSKTFRGRYGESMHFGRPFDPGE